MQRNINRAILFRADASNSSPPLGGGDPRTGGGGTVSPRDTMMEDEDLTIYK